MKLGEVLALLNLRAKSHWFIVRVSYVIAKYFIFQSEISYYLFTVQESAYAGA